MWVREQGKQAYLGGYVSKQNSNCLAASCFASQAYQVH